MERKNLKQQIAAILQIDTQTAIPPEQPEEENHPQNPGTNTLTQQDDIQQEIQQTQHIQTEDDLNEADYSRHIEVFNEIYTKIQGTDPSSRPYIPRIQDTQDTKEMIAKINSIIKKRIPNNNDITLEEMHTLVYCGAITATQTSKHPKDQDKNNNRPKKYKIPPWQHRLETKILKLRKEVGQITQYLKGNLSQKSTIRRILSNSTRETIIELLDTKKQQLQAQAKRLKRYKKSNERKTENKLFNINQKKFYRSLETPEQQINNPPSTVELQQFWENIWSNAVEHNRQATWITDEVNKQHNIQPMEQITISYEDVTRAISHTHNWKTPGSDKIQNYWLKSFTSIHQPLMHIFNKYLAKPDAVPPFLTEGNTYMKPKDADTTNPAKYRPITCLPTMYKLLTAIITHKLNTHLENNNIMAEEQKGCRKGSRGCKEQLVIDAEIQTQAKKK